MPTTEIPLPDNRTTAAGPPPLRWSAHPARQRPGATLFALVVIAVTSLLAGVLLESLPSGLLAAGILFVSLGRYFFRSEYELDGEGLTIRTCLGTRRIRWSEVKRFGYDDLGGILTRSAEPSRMDAFRGFHMFLPADAATVIERISLECRKASAENGRDR